jgi:membrane protease YdiL (CAAX protease family)
MLPRERMKQSSPTAAVPLILLVASAAIEQLRLVVMLLLLVGLVILLLARRRAGSVPGALLPYAACLLVSVNLVWDSLGLPASLPGGASCADVLSPFAVFRALGALVVLTCLALILRLVRAAPWEIGLRWPSRAWMLMSLAALPALGTAAALIGPPLAEPFFGPVAAATPDLRALVPGLLFAVTNSSMEEAVYRGVLLRWLTPAFGLASAMALQAIVFGLAHGTGTDFIGSPLPVMAATAATGLALGVLAVRTGSLLPPIAIHIALDIPVYYGKVCLGT